MEEQVSITVEDQEIVMAESERESSVSSSELFKIFRPNGMVKLEQDNNDYKVIKNSFVMGMGTLGKEIDVVAIHKNSCSSLAGQARSEAFKIFSEAVAKKNGGDANIKYAWYAASRDEICQILAHGFCQFRQPENRQFYGFGIHLFPAKFSIDGALASVPDSNGLRHILLCRVILGNMEVVCPGSQQFQPSSMEFDSGVDNLTIPRRYIIWSAYMNSHILPNYFISFRAPISIGFQRINMRVEKPNSPYITVNTLMNILAKFLHPSQMTLIEKYRSDFQQKKMVRLQFIQKLRQIAGDKLLMKVINICRYKSKFSGLQSAKRQESP